MERREYVEILACDSRGHVVYQESFATDIWYDAEHDLIDTNEARVRLGVSSIIGRQYNADGQLAEEWIAKYAPDGSITSLQEWLSDGSTRRWKWSPDGVMNWIE